MEDPMWRSRGAKLRWKFELDFNFTDFFLELNVNIKTLSKIWQHTNIATPEFVPDAPFS